MSTWTRALKPECTTKPGSQVSIPEIQILAATPKSLHFSLPQVVLLHSVQQGSGGGIQDTKDPEDTEGPGSTGGPVENQGAHR